MNPKSLSLTCVGYLCVPGSAIICVGTYVVPIPLVGTWYSLSGLAGSHVVTFLHFLGYLVRLLLLIPLLSFTLELFSGISLVSSSGLIMDLYSTCFRGFLMPILGVWIQYLRRWFDGIT